MEEINAGIDISQFLFEDLSIDLEKLAYVVTETVKVLENNAVDNDVTLGIYGLDTYFMTRNVPNTDEKQRREEKSFILSFVSAVAMEASERDTLVVKYVQ